MADGADRLAGLEELADELERRLVGAQFIRVVETAGDHEGVIIVRLRLAQGTVYGDVLAGVEMLEASNRALLG